ncbi:MAG: SdrD B-like domain-containing protein [Candidatus Aquicultor sp.]|nr:SdrD B-like domain-containing protein [Candidatus Aquicultor sp.]
MYKSKYLRFIARMKEPSIGLSIVALMILTVLMLSPIGIAEAAPPSANLDQLRNGSASSPVNPGTWVNGNLGAQTAHYAEGYSVPYRCVMKDLPTATPITITLGYDIKHSGKHALDYLTHFNRINSPPHQDVFGHPVETFDPKTGVFGVFATVGTFDIPAPSSTGSPVAGQPTTSFNALPVAERKMTLFGGTITNIAYVTHGSLTASQSETRIAVTFTAASSTAVLAWGGHIGSRADWGFVAGVPRSAGGISGSPYHMRLIGWTLNNLGNQDRSLSAVAVYSPPASKSGMKFNDLNANGAKDAGEPGLSGWTIYVDYNDNGAKDAGEPSAVTAADGTYTITGIKPGTYKVREVAQAGWTQSFPASGYHEEIFTSGATLTDNDFGNYIPMKYATAWAYDPDRAVTFISQGISNNWGWYNGSYADPGTYKLDLYAGAAQNDLTKGTKVGQVTVSYVDGKVKVTYTMYSGYTLKDVRVYIGNTAPTTSSPGQYLQKSDEEYAFTGGIYVAFHGVAGMPSMP